jgi:NADPH:quinone reductase-like Zn-dependent oxidoreductase
LKVEEVPTPSPSDGEALVEVKAAGINPSDVKNVEGKMHGTTLPRIPGRDFAGVVVRGPADWIGKEVWGTGGDIGFTRDGSHAQFILLPATALALKPKNLSMDAAGSAGLVFVTAWSALVTAANVLENETVLIIGAGGGVGSAAVQIAKARGAKVIGAVRAVEDEKRVRENGADEIINTSSAKLDAVGGKAADVVFDTSGQMFAQSIEAAAMGGRIPIIAAMPDGQATFNLRNLYRKELRVIGVDTRRLDVIACAKLLNQMQGNFESGQFKPDAGEAFSLAKAAHAYEQAEHGKGRVYLRPKD